MYSNIKSRVFNGNEYSDFFPCEVGVRQGENLSPLLFAIYLNDLESFFQNKNVHGLKTISEDIERELNHFLKLFVILYADDTVLMSETHADLQNQIDALHEYCNQWKLKVNVQKSKVVIFSKGRPPRNLRFVYNGNELEIVDEFSYLGILYSRTGSFTKAKKSQAEKATRAVYDIIKKGRLHNLNIETHLELFDKIVKPILLYGCEVWGIGDNSIIERVHLKFCKLLLNLKKSTPDFMIYGELGRYPLDICIKLRIINYWVKLIHGKQEKLPVILYQLAKKNYCENIPWVMKVKNILDNSGLSVVWTTQNFTSGNWLYNTLKLNLIDQFKQSWNNTVQNSPKALNYRLYKDNLQFENFFNILDDKNIVTLSRFRTLNNKLPIETGRWQNVPRENRKCNLCNSGDIGDEFHYIFTCSSLMDSRRQFLKAYYTNRPNILKFKSLMNSSNPLILNNLCKFIRIVNAYLDSPG